jgi:hypothetical protein
MTSSVKIEVDTENFNSWELSERKVTNLVLAYPIFLKFDIFLPQLHCDFSRAGSTLMLSNMVGGR